MFQENPGFDNDNAGLQMLLNVYGDTLCAQVTATAMAQTGHQVNWYVTTPGAWTALEQGAALYKEQGLRFLLEDQRRSGRLKYRLLEDAGEAVDARVVFLALHPGNEVLARQIVALHGDKPGCELVVNQSMGPVGVSEELRKVLQDAGSATELVAMPDTLQQGNAYDNFTRPDSILLGCESKAAEVLVHELFRPFNRRRDVIRVMTLREAEFSKLAISGILATRISYMNDMAHLSESLGVDINVVRQALGADPRIGDAYLYPGCGFGGPGLSRNVLTLAAALHEKDPEPGLLDQVLRINERQKEVLFRKFWRHFSGNVAGKKVAIWGVSFKPGTHRVDNSPALKVIQALWAQDVQVAVHDPQGIPELARWAEGKGKVEVNHDPYAATDNADALMLVTEWKRYWSPDWARLKLSMREPLILDGRNIYDPGFVRAQGLMYEGIGR